MKVFFEVSSKPITGVVQQGAKRSVQLGRRGVSSKEYLADVTPAAASLLPCQDRADSGPTKLPANSSGTALLMSCLFQFAGRSMISTWCANHLVWTPHMCDHHHCDAVLELQTCFYTLRRHW